MSEENTNKEAVKPEDGRNDKPKPRRIGQREEALREEGKEWAAK
jgi:hypothetical protein